MQAVNGKALRVAATTIRPGLPVHYRLMMIIDRTPASVHHLSRGSFGHGAGHHDPFDRHGPEILAFPKFPPFAEHADAALRIPYISASLTPKSVGHEEIINPTSAKNCLAVPLAIARVPLSTNFLAYTLALILLPKERIMSPTLRPGSM